jgi:hypothetical protein
VASIRRRPYLICSLWCSAGGICREAFLFEKYGVAVFVSQSHESLVFLLWFIAAAVGIVEMAISDYVVCGGVTNEGRAFLSRMSIADVGTRRLQRI